MVCFYGVGDNIACPATDQIAAAKDVAEGITSNGEPIGVDHHGRACVFFNLAESKL